MINQEEKLKKIMASVFNVSPGEIDEGCAVGSFKKWDSLAHMNLIVILEQEYDLELSDDDVADMLSYAIIKKIIDEKQKKVK
jgi:acyl carrier protein